MAQSRCQQPVQPSLQAARGHRQSMLADQSLLAPIAQVQTVQQQIQDGLRKLPRRPGQNLQQVPAAPDRMRQAALVKCLQEPVPGPGSVMHQKAIVIGPAPPPLPQSPDAARSDTPDPLVA